VTGRRRERDPGCGVGTYRVSQALPFSMEVRDGQLLLLVVGFCVGPLYAVIVGVYRGAAVYKVGSLVVSFRFAK
jgi:hypothetical protein